MNTKLWYNKAAKNYLEGLPLGNGSMGVVCLGGEYVDRFALNEDSMWSGYDHVRTNIDSPGAVREAQKLMLEGNILEAEKIFKSRVSPTPDEMSHYEPLADLIFVQDMRKEDEIEYAFRFRDLKKTDMSVFDRTVENYNRNLDILTGVHTVSYKYQGIDFLRETFVSNPDKVVAIKSLGKSPLVMFRRSDYIHETSRISNDTIFIKGMLNSIEYFCACRAVGDSVTAIGDRLYPGNDAIIYCAAATSFNCKNPRKQCVELLDKAVRKGYDTIKADHIKDLTELTNRCILDIKEEQTVSNLPTNERVQRVKEGKKDKQLIALLFNYGRYLLCSSSREGSLPANLQGIWNEEFSPSWGSKFTTNINLEMNYWPAEITNLTQTHKPLFDLMKRMQVKGVEVAKKVYEVKNGGWVAHNNTDIFADCDVAGSGEAASFWPLGAAWLCDHVMEHYRFTGDKEFLAENFYLIKGAVDFFEDFLIEDNKGHLISCPSISPENSYYVDGKIYSFCLSSGMDREILNRLYTDIIEACTVLDKDHSIYEKTLSKIEPIGISKSGRILEWENEYIESQPGHRHMSHLFALYPGNQISFHKTKDLIKAARRTLDYRLINGGGGTGWSRAWLISFMARFHDAEGARENAEVMLAKSIYSNLFDSHPPFQIDGNFGYTAGIAEMLLQSQEGFIEFMPAFSKEWEEGCICGLRARGGYTVDISFTKESFKSDIVSDFDNELLIYNKNVVSIDNKQYPQDVVTLPVFKGQKICVVGER